MKNEENKFSSLFLLSFASQLGFSLAMPLVVCIGLGVLADNKLGVEPAGITTGIILGFITSFYMLWKNIKPYIKK
ncbi:hypothetical protein COX08_01585 [Candidatus Beckwithbacteria bacterium CG23_combo_of_CG06-09_8_20_14_all_34_8]|uniref:AtpZ/AtpI family protein n=1 Tax=Candidatus Beckwithbacteria bacterium CG23_combo_of_CG06-09_8_20_14_all_34_8 TaxID=1974497 RepID=A0A2H0B8Q5_9BACT|nr:MAG: hypothetical protein COX08_01585 [Candidatus Beckwithbacteria bacterium CG23_combo_of_CG06-09_8_20_14_all_34_8]